MAKQPSFGRRLWRELWNGAAWIFKRWFGWGIAAFLYALGANAMFSDQYLVASSFYFAAILIAGIKTAIEAKADDKKYGTMVIIVVVSVGVFFASLWWVKHTHEQLAKQEDVTPAIVDWVHAHTVFIRSLPWRWILAGLAVGFLASSIINVKRHRKTAQEVAPTVEDLVKWNAIEQGEFNLEPNDRPFVEFIFTIFNASLPSISILDRGSGRARYRSQPLDTEAYIRKNEAKDIQYGCHGVFMLRQRLTKEECEQIRRANPNASNEMRLDITDVLISAETETGKTFRLKLPDSIDLPFTEPVKLISSSLLEKLEEAATHKHDECEKTITDLQLRAQKSEDLATTRSIQVHTKINDLKAEQEKFAQLEKENEQMRRELLTKTQGVEFDITSLIFDVTVEVEPDGLAPRVYSGFAGTTGKYKPLKSFGMWLTQDVSGLSLGYQGFFEDGTSSDFMDAGTSVERIDENGKKLEIRGFCVKLQGEEWTKYDVVYSAHVRGTGNLERNYMNGEFCGTDDRAIEGMKVVVCRKGIKLPPLL